LIVLTISFSVVVLPHSAIGSKKNNIEKFLPLKQELVKTKKTEERYKTIILRAKRKVTMLSDRLTEIGLKLKAQKQKKRQLLMAVISLSRYPKPSPISSTFLPLSITRTHTLMKLFSQQLNEEIRSLQSNNNKFSDLKTLISIESQKIDNANKKLILLHAEIDALIDKSIGRVTSTTLSNSNTFEKIYKMLKDQNIERKRSIDILSLILTQKNKTPLNSEPQRRFFEKNGDSAEIEVTLRDTNFPTYSSFAKNKLRLELPVRGKITEAFGELDKIGLKNKGINIVTPFGARVFSSFDGKVLYANNFRNFGPVLIIDHGDGFNTLMVGLERIDVNIGQNLLKGELVGVMEKFKTSENHTGPALYIELRRNGKPVNPLAWLSPKRNAT
tara:strand:- start:1647 stop:2804 length:1158 start_codon:yes stop_codon:yes gene_type:complete